MSIFGILFILMVVLGLAGVLLRIFLAGIKLFFLLIPTLIVLGLCCLFATLWGGVMYADGNVGLARATFLVGSLFFATFILGFFLRPFRLLARIDMALFLALGITFVILSINLSKSVLQPNVELLAYLS